MWFICDDSLSEVNVWTLYEYGQEGERMPQRCVQEHCPQRFGGALVWTLTSGRIVTAFGTKKAAGGWFM